ncbi:hypothetical protein Bbelb_279100 [Branchiostoma belcheri]|nr:hypothetical protein Bbelb_279100 [Branchiostoma belcheri]
MSRFRTVSEVSALIVLMALPARSHGDLVAHSTRAPANILGQRDSAESAVIVVNYKPRGHHEVPSVSSHHAALCGPGDGDNLEANPPNANPPEAECPNANFSPDACATSTPTNEATVTCGTYPDLEDCTKFYMCSNGISSSFSCPDGLLFDIKTLRCEWPEEATCGTSSS